MYKGEVCHEAPCEPKANNCIYSLISRNSGINATRRARQQHFSYSQNLVDQVPEAIYWGAVMHSMRWDLFHIIYRAVSDIFRTRIVLQQRDKATSALHDVEDGAWEEAWRWQPTERCVLQNNSIPSSYAVPDFNRHTSTHKTAITNHIPRFTLLFCVWLLAHNDIATTQTFILKWSSQSCWLDAGIFWPNSPGMEGGR